MKLSNTKSDQDAKISTGTPGTLNSQRFEAVRVHQQPILGRDSFPIRYVSPIESCRQR